MEDSIIRSLFLFRNLDHDEINFLISALRHAAHPFRTEDFSAGDIISEGGEICHIISGSADIKTSKDSDSILRRVGAGDTFGAGMLYSDDNASPTIAIARTKTKAFFIPKTAVDILIERSPKTAKNYIAYLSGKISFLNRRIRAFSAGDTETKLAVYLYQLSCEGECCTDISIADSYTAVAKKLNMGRASLYRTLDSLERRSIISRNGNTISILKLDELLKIIK